MKRRTFSAYGLRVRSPFELPVFESPAGTTPGPYGEADLTLRLDTGGEIADRWSAASGVPAWQTMFASHCHVRVERGRAGDHLLTFGRTASFHLDSAGESLLCSPTAAKGIEWQRFLLDTVLYCVSLLRGFEALHASAVCVDDRVVAIVAAPGGGKSTFAAELVRRGHSLFADDVLALSPGEGGVLAHPGPPLMTLTAASGAVEELGEPLAGPGDDGLCWVRVGRTCERPRPLAATFILDRHQEEGLQRLREGAPGRLLPHMLSLDRDPARALARFGLLRGLAGKTPIYRLCAPDGDLAEPAGLVERELRSAQASAGAVPSTTHHARAA